MNATAEFRKQGWDPVQAAILAKIQPALTAELERTAQPEKRLHPKRKHLSILSRSTSYSESIVLVK